MAPQNSLVQSLAALKRRQLLTGIPTSDRDILNVQEPYFAAARENAGVDAALALEREKMGTQAQQFGESMAESKNQFGLNLAETKRQAEERIAQERANAAMAEEQAAKARKLGYVSTGIGALGTGAALWSTLRPSPPATTTGSTATEAALTASDEAAPILADMGTSAVPTTEATSTGYLGAASPYVAGLGYYALAKAGMKAQEKIFPEHTTMHQLNKAADISTEPKYMAQGIGKPLSQQLLGEKTTENLEPSFYAFNPLAGVADIIAGQSLGEVAENYIPVYNAVSNWSDKSDTDKAITIASGGLVGGGCIIVTACTDKHSPEVDITREYRDKYLSPEELRGYYMVAEKVVPFIQKYSIVKKIVKKFLVDNLIEYGKYTLGKTDSKPSHIVALITKGFLSLCGRIGSQRDSFVRLNGEVV